MPQVRSITITEAQQLIDTHTRRVADDRLVSDPKISVCLVTYNHRAYIEQALDSVLSQQTSVPVEIVIGDDGSNDGTADVLQDYQKRHPEQICVLLADSNLGQHTGNGRLNFVRTLTACRGACVAMLDGDDYWSSPRKLQMQWDALEAHPEWAICFHRAQIVFDGSDQVPRVIPDDDARDVCSLSDLMAGNFMATASVMFRNGLIPELPEWFYNVRYADWPLHVLNAQHGDIGFLQPVMSVHRVHQRSTYDSLDYGLQWKATLDVFDHLKNHLNERSDVDTSVAFEKLTERMFDDLTKLSREVGDLRYQLSLSPPMKIAWLALESVRRVRRSIRAVFHSKQN